MTSLSSMNVGLVLGVLALVAIAVAAVSVALLLRSQRRHSEQLRRVIERLDSLEAAGILDPGAVSPSSVAASAGTAEGETITPAGDVLAGMTSHVRRMVEDGQEAPISMADEAIVCVYEKLDAPLTPSALSEELCISLRSLERGLSAGLDCTPRQLIRAVKMREARQMLLSGRYNVAEVASRTGFSSPFHFSRTFKDFFGVAPSLMRQDGAIADRAQRGS